ncbi:MAG: iron-containing alcohol dehydrogenase family protein [Solirubrobacterales bacterium]
MASRTITIPRLLHVGPDCLSDLAPLLSEHFDISRVCVGSGPGPSREFASTVEHGLTRAGARVVGESGLIGRLDQAAELAARTIAEEVTLLIGIGGGRVIDTVKLAAARTGTDFISVPTTISHDGISSPVASLTYEGRLRSSYAAAMPAGIIVDVSVIALAPPRTLRAGAGDLLSNLLAIQDWQLADRRGEDKFDAFSAMIAETAARPLLNITDLHTPTSHELLAKGLLLSGLAMAAAGTSRPCSGAEHLVSHSLDEALGKRAALHGEQVALGCLLSAAAHESPLLGELKTLYGRLGLPSHPADLGISMGELTKAVLRAPSTRPERYTVLTDLLDSGGRQLAEVLGEAFGQPRFTAPGSPLRRSPASISSTSPGAR